MDTAGDALERYVYSPYGVLTIYDATWTDTRGTSSYANVSLYTGRELDAETGLYYYRNRYYSAKLGRFLSRDPVGYWDGLNRFLYTWSNPLARSDPAGLLGICAHKCSPIHAQRNVQDSRWSLHNRMSRFEPDLAASIGGDAKRLFDLIKLIGGKLPVAGGQAGKIGWRRNWREKNDWNRCNATAP